MSDILLSIIIGALAGIGYYLILGQSQTAPPASRANDTAGDAPDVEIEAKPLPEDPPSLVPPVVPLAAVSDAATLTAALLPLGRTLSPLAEEVSHPGLLPNMPEFQAAVAAFRHAEATTRLLGDYALGDDWPMACAALTVLAERPEGETLRDPVLRHLPNTRPYVLLYAFRFLASLEQRPPVGAIVLAAHGGRTTRSFPTSSMTSSRVMTSWATVPATVTPSTGTPSWTALPWSGCCRRFSTRSRRS